MMSSLHHGRSFAPARTFGPRMKLDRGESLTQNARSGWEAVIEQITSLLPDQSLHLFPAIAGRALSVPQIRVCF